MKTQPWTLARFVLFSTIMYAFLGSTLPAQPLVPTEVGTTVNGFQDDFEGSTLTTGWMVRGTSVYSVGNGVLRVTTAAGDPNHLLYEAGNYNNTVQEVLARIRVMNFGTGDGPRCGVSAGVDTATSQGINLDFRDEPSPGQRHMEFLDDARAWGPEYGFNWQNNTWYWLRLRHEPNAASQGGVNDVFMKIWPADGTQAEPANWQTSYDYIPARTARTGFAGLAASSLGGTAEFEVDYMLIKASGLPGIRVAPNAFPLYTPGPVVITNQPRSLLVLPCRPVTFSVEVDGTPPCRFQWFRDGQPISGATNAIYTLPDINIQDNGAVFHVIASNMVNSTAYTAVSSNAVLTVSADTWPPTLIDVSAASLSEVVVTFSEPVTLDSATAVANYQITSAGGALPISGATLASNQTNVFLATTGIVEGITYTLTVNNIRSVCLQNTITPNSQQTFSYIPYQAQDIGTPPVPGNLTRVADGYDLSGSGADIGGSGDQFAFSFQQRTGDFDVQARLESLGATDAWSEAGLMARESLLPGSRFASVLATPGLAGCYFQSRSATNSSATQSGRFPANYPYTWLRLQRAGNQFTGYASWDGQSWTQLGTVSLSLPGSLYFGMAVSSHNATLATTATFRDLANVTGATLSPAPPARESLGQSSRRTSLVISEIMYHPADTRGTANTNAQGFITNSLEYIELFNALSEPADLSGYRLSGDISYVFPANTTLAAGSFLVVAKSPADLERVHGISGVHGPYTNSLPDDAGTVRLRNRADAIFLEVNYGSQAPWPIAADGAGHSLVLARPSYGERSPLGWAASDAIGGSPGRYDPVSPEPLRPVVINEFLAHTDDPELDFVELYNHSNQAVDVSGCFLSDARDTNKFMIPVGTTIPARGFVSFDQGQLGFALKASGDTIYLRNASNTRVLDAMRFQGQANGVSSGRSPDGAETIRPLAQKTPAAPNSAAWRSDIVINEILYHPISKDDDQQFVELFNRGTNLVNLGGWKFVAGIEFTFPSNVVIGPNAYLVVARNAERLRTNYLNLGSGNLVGNFNGRLSHGGERIALARPDLLISTNNQGRLITNLIDVVVNEVSYQDGGRWGQWSDGGGSSLELTDPRSDNQLAANWADSDETKKAPWTILSVPGSVANGTVAADQLQVLLQGAGECLIDDVEVLTTANANLIANSTFESNATGWTAEGTESSFGWETGEGYNSARCYHVRAIERGDNQMNRIRTPLTSTLAANATVTIRAKTRWLRGHPEILFRTRGNGLEAVGRMEVPANSGTPGARNSRAAENALPAIYAVTHQPILPAAGQPVVVTARVDDPDGVTRVWLDYRVDPATNWTAVTMTDNGTGGDAIAGDGLFSATIPGQTAGTLVAFFIQAVDLPARSAVSVFPGGGRECLVRFGEDQPMGSFPVYRLWMTQATFNRWSSRHKLDNTPNDITFVLGGERAIYNVQALFAGSPYIAPGFSTPSGNRCGYSITFPSDDRFLGDTDLVLDWPGGHGNENTGVQEQMAYWMAEHLNLPFSHRYFIRLQVNGVTDMQRGGVFEAVMQPGGDFIEMWSADDPDGDFYKIDRAFEFNDTGGLATDPQPQLRVYTTASGAKDPKAYRWMWLKRSFDSANNYTNILLLADALNATNTDVYTSQTEGLADVEQWMRIFTVEHILNAFDSWGHEIGKNMYMYKPRHGKWQLYMFDLDWLMLVSQSRQGYNPAYPLFTQCNDPTVLRMYNHPPFRRACLRTVYDAVNGPLLNAHADPVMDAKYAALLANGISMIDGGALQNPTVVKNWFRDRRNYLLTQLAATNTSFTVTATNNVSAGDNLAILRGTAPLQAAAIMVNGKSWPVTWTSLTNWMLRIPLTPGTNQFLVLGYDLNQRLVSGASNLVTVPFGGSEASPQDFVVFNEMMYHPAAPEAGFVELYNRSSSASFDLSGWRINGLDYTFPAGTLLTNGQYLVVAKNLEAFGAAYGSTVLPIGEYAGQLDNDGETLSLIKPGSTNAADLVVDRIRYEDASPWLASADGNGPSLQLIDAAQDNARVSNWADGSGWRRFSTNLGIGQFYITNFYLYLDGPGEVHLDNMSLIRFDGTNLIGTNLLENGDFEAPLAGAWSLGTNYQRTEISATATYAGDGALRLVSTARTTAINPNTTLSQSVAGKLMTNPPAMYNFSFWYLPTTNAGKLLARLSSIFRLEAGLQPVNPFTPGLANTTVGTLPAYDPVWLNELAGGNTSGPTDQSGKREPWIELYNGGTNPVSLAGYYLADNYSTNLLTWAFPIEAVIQPGEYKVVFADGEPAESTISEWHTSFRLAPASGTVALVRVIDGQRQITDYLTYTNIGAGLSYGDNPDGQPFSRRIFHSPTPGTTNSAPPVDVFINEWIADNAGTLDDPDEAGLNYEDWFELHNAGSSLADLSGYYLSDTTVNRTHWRIPNRTVIPPQGYLLVWADGEPGQNTTNAMDLHAGFQLSRSGDAISLFAPDGTVVDQVVFGAQATDISQGRYPNGQPGTNYVSFTNATPRSPNVLGVGGDNQPPQLSNLPDRQVILGQSLSFTVSGTDPDAGQSLSFSLLGSVPAEASCSAAGQFTWTPTAAQAPSTNLITVQVTDNGSPALNTTDTFLVYVVLPPAVQIGRGVTGSQVALSFPTIAGKRYQVLYKNDLNETTWQSLGAVQTANSESLALTDDLGTHPHRFYRIQVVE